MARRREWFGTGNGVSPSVTRLPGKSDGSGMWVSQTSSIWTHTINLNAKKVEKHLELQVNGLSKTLWTYRMFKEPHHSQFN